jgi:hypothetical protein
LESTGFNRPETREAFMDNWTFGLSMLIVGMGGTLLTLMIMSALMGVLKRIFPIREGEEE